MLYHRLSSISLFARIDVLSFDRDQSRRASAFTNTPGQKTHSERSHGDWVGEDGGAAGSAGRMVAGSENWLLGNAVDLGVQTMNANCGFVYV